PRGQNSSLSSVLLQIVYHLSAIYFLVYFLATLSLIIFKSQVLSYPDANLWLDVCLLLTAAALEAARLYCARGILLQSETSIGASLCLTVFSVVLSVYFLVWQSYVTRADLIANGVLLSGYAVAGLLGFFTFARFTRSEVTGQPSHIRRTARFRAILSYSWSHRPAGKPVPRDPRNKISNSRVKRQNRN
uniref:Transmembrane protein 80 n=1 Tax=Denticeps clupeoides TaxID=299321 RepID=A0AAY4DYR8_9TELE